MNGSWLARIFTRASASVNHPALSISAKVALALDCESRHDFPAALPDLAKRLIFCRRHIDTELFRPPIRPDGERPFTLVAVGRVTPVKRIEMMIDALAELSGRGIEIGSHTKTHPHLCRLSDFELHAELRESRERGSTICSRTSKGGAKCPT